MTLTSIIGIHQNIIKVYKKKMLSFFITILLVLP